MSKERELLKRLLAGDNRGDFFISNELLKEIEELLHNPEQEPIYIVGEGWQIDEMPAEGVKLYTSPPIPEPTAESVAWYWEQSDFYDPEWCYMADTGDKPVENRFRRNIQPLYLAPPKREPIAYVADPSVGFDVSLSAQGMPLIWLGKLEYGDKLYRVGKDDEKDGDTHE